MFKKPKAAICVSAIVAFLVIVFQGCNQKQAKRPLKKIIVAEAHQPIAGPVYVAFEKGYFQEQGLSVELQQHSSGKSSLNAVLNGKADFGTVAETPIMYACMRKQNIYTIATIHHSNKNTVIVASKEKGISTPADLKGKLIGVSIGTNGEYFLDTFLLQAGILREEIEFVDIAPEQMLNAITKKAVDAVATWNPHAINIQNKLGNKGITFYGGDIYSETFNIVLREDFFDKNSEAAELFLQALVKAEEFIKNYPEESKKIISNSIGMKDPLLHDLWHIYKFEVSLKKSFPMMLRHQARWAIRNKLVKEVEPPNFLDCIQPQPLMRIKPGAVDLGE